MRYTVECYENQSLFNPEVQERDRRVLFITPDDAAWAVRQPNLLVHVFVVEAESAQHAADKAFEIAGAPWNPADTLGATWDHTKVRSMCSGDNVWVHTPDGMVGYTCMGFGWNAFTPADMNIAAMSLT